MKCCKNFHNLSGQSIQYNVAYLVQPCVCYIFYADLCAIRDKRQKLHDGEK